MITDPLHLPAPELTDDRREALWTALHATIDADTHAGSAGGRSWLRRHRRITVGGLAAVLITTGGTAYAVRLISSTPPASNSLFCYSEVSADQGIDAPGATAVGVPEILADGTTLGPATVVDPAGVCGNLYRQGALELGVAHLPGPITLATNDPVPQLTACVRGDGTVGVEPGGPAVCAAVGMVPFIHYRPPSP